MIGWYVPAREESYHDGCSPDWNRKHFKASFGKFRAQAHLNDALEKMRHKAWDHFLTLGLPSRQNEVYRYIKLRHLYTQTIYPATEKTFPQRQC